MPIGNRARLLAVTTREFRELVGERTKAPGPRSFKPMRLNVDAFGRNWDSKRGAAMRLAAVLLKDDDQAMERRVCADDRTTTTYSDATSWLEREAAYLRKTARLLETAVSACQSCWNDADRGQRSIAALLLRLLESASVLLQ